MVNYFRERSEKMVAYKDASTMLREDMDIMNTIVDVLKPKGITNYFLEGIPRHHSIKQVQAAEINAKEYDEKRLDQMFVKIKEFSTIKKVMEKNSEFIRLNDN
jgi:hypothetical protein